MKRFLILCFILLLTLQNLVVKTQELTKPTDTTGWQKFLSAEQKYCIQIPPAWVVNFKNDDGDYIFHSTSTPKDVNNLSIAITCKSVDKNYTLEKFCEDSKNAAKGIYTDFAYVDSREDQVNGVKTKWFTFSFSEGEFKKQGNQYCFVFNGKAYNITFSGTIGVFNDKTEFLTSILNTFDVASYQPCAKVTMNPPTKWFTSKDADCLLLFSAKDTGGKSISDGVIKVIQRKLVKNLEPIDFVHQLQAEIKKERPKVTFGPNAGIPDLNGQKIQWFDIVEKDSLLLERYYVTTYQRCGFAILNICDKTKFDTDFKMLFASSLITFKLEK